MTSTTPLSEVWSHKTFAVVTGASRGIGQAIAEKLAETLAPGSVLLLISRDEVRLTSIQQALQKTNPLLQIEIGVSDLSTTTATLLNEIFSKVFRITVVISSTRFVGDSVDVGAKLCPNSKTI